MRIGVVFPQTELGGDAGAVRAGDDHLAALATAAEAAQTISG